MNRKILFALWALLFILCAGCGFIPEPAGGVRILLTLLSLVFFLPPALVLYDAAGKQATDAVRLIRNLAALSLGLTALLLILNFLAAFSSEILGQMLHDTLTVVSSPMVCSGHWATSLFLWACLLVASGKLLKR